MYYPSHWNSHYYCALQLYIQCTTPVTETAIITVHCNSTYSVLPLSLKQPLWLCTATLHTVYYPCHWNSHYYCALQLYIQCTTPVTETAIMTVHCNSTYSVLPLSLKQPLLLCTATLHTVYYPCHWNSHYDCALQLYIQCTTPVTETAIITVHCNSTYSVLPLSLKQPLWLCTATLHTVYYPSHWNSHYNCALQLYLQCTTPVTETAIMTVHCNSTYSVLSLSLKQPLWLCTATLHTVYYPSHWNSHYNCALQLYLQCTTPVTETAIMTVHCNSTYSVLPQSLKQPLWLCTATPHTVYYPSHWNSHYYCALQLSYYLLEPKYSARTTVCWSLGHFHCV